jgi:hypothetical protein
MRTIANVLAPTSIDVEKGTNANAHTAAVVICHGMGQQVKWQTLGQLVNSLERAGKLDPTFAPRVRQVQFTDDKGPFYQGRAELLVCDAETDAARHVHVYEAYWAPLTEGRISLSQTVVFLITAGLSGIRHAFGPLRRYGRFSTTDRAATSKVHEFPPDRGVLFSFLVALLVLLALLVMNTAITVTQLKALASATERPQDRTLLALLTGDLWAFELHLPFERRGRCAHSRGSRGGGSAAPGASAVPRFSVDQPPLTQRHHQRASRFLSGRRQRARPAGRYPDLGPYAVLVESTVGRISSRTPVCARSIQSQPIARTRQTSMRRSEAREAERGRCAPFG